MAVREVLKLQWHVAPFKAVSAQYFLRDGVRHILGSVGIGVENCWDRVSSPASVPGFSAGISSRAATAFTTAGLSGGTESAGISDAFNCNRHQSRHFNPTTILVSVEGFH
jgi:hypothetical protein